ncbi:MAG: porin [Proteobacteria bacterium]|nr:porin [Pseudomonadota bacterium]
MNFKKTVAIVTAAGAMAAISVPAMALENEFHGMYRAFGFMTNAFSGASGFNLAADSATDKFIEQRARLMYIAKANDDLKLVTQFEIDTKFGGSSSTKYPIGDGGGLDADRISLETKNVYLDFKIPLTPVRAMVGIQPFNDAFQGTFGLFDATGAVFTGKTGDLTATYGYFTVGNSNTSFDYKATPNGISDTGTNFPSNKGSQDLNVIDLKYAVNKNLTVGTSYYMLLDKVGTATVANNTVGLNAATKVGPVDLAASFGLQFGKSGVTTLTNTGTTAFGGSVVGKIAAGPGKIDVSALYLSGDKDASGYNHAWQSIGTGVNYFNAANMWLLVRNGAEINTATQIGGSSDITRGGHGLMGVFAGYEGTAGKMFYNANVGYARVAEKQAASSSSIGTELNATVGYKLYDNMSASFTGAYAILGDGYGKENVMLLNGKNVGKSYDNPFMTNIALNYAF